MPPPLQARPRDAATGSSRVPRTAARGRGSGDADCLEFGGSLTVSAIIVLSHVFIYWVYLSVSCNHGFPLVPTDVQTLHELWGVLRDKAVPNPAVVLAYLSYLAALGVLALVCPGPEVRGYPLPRRRPTAAAKADLDIKKQKNNDHHHGMNQKSREGERSGDEGEREDDDDDDDDDRVDGGSSRGVRRRARRLRNECETPSPPSSPPPSPRTPSREEKMTGRGGSTEADEKMTKEEDKDKTAATARKTAAATTTTERGDIRLTYCCNALSAWWVTLLTVAVVTAACGDAPLVWVADNWGRLLTCAAGARGLLVRAHIHYIAARRKRWLN